MSRRHLVVSAAGVAAFAASAPLLTPTTRAMAATPAASASLDAVLQSGVDRGLTGVALRIERGGDVIFDGAAGLANVERKTPLATTDLFGIGSITKTFIATLVLQLVADGGLSLDDTVTHWLEDPVVARIPYVEQITIRQLLTHTSGIYDVFADDSPLWVDAYFGDGADWARIWKPEEVLAYADGAKHAPAFEPGTSVGYSNTGYVLLGLILEQADGHSYAAQGKARILEPLGMTDTYFPTAPALTGVAVPYHLIDGNLVNIERLSRSALGAAGGMMSSTRDVARFARALFGGALLTPELFAEMTAFVPSGRPGMELGMGVFELTDVIPEPLVGNSGDAAGCSARMYRLQEADLTFVLMTNTGGADETADAVFAQAVQVTLATVLPALAGG